MRSGREKGCWVFIPESELAKAGYAEGVDGEPAPAPLYRTWASPRGRVVVQLYRSQQPPARNGNGPSTQEHESGYSDSHAGIPAETTGGNDD
jgi:hypothetical protein